MLSQSENHLNSEINHLIDSKNSGKHKDRNTLELSNKTYSISNHELSIYIIRSHWKDVSFSC